MSKVVILREARETIRGDKIGKEAHDVWVEYSAGLWRTCSTRKPLRE